LADKRLGRYARPLIPQSLTVQNASATAARPPLDGNAAQTELVSRVRDRAGMLVRCQTEIVTVCELVI
jgi:hypothetical protein